MVKTPSQTIPPLVNGDRLNRDEFERRYNAMTNSKKAELIEGIVYKTTAFRFKSHNQPHALIMGWLFSYAAIKTQLAWGIEPTVRLDLENKPQPDAILMITPNAEVQARFSEDDYYRSSTRISGRNCGQ